MTPSEKAKELIDKFWNIDQCEQHYYEKSPPCEHMAKRCAIIAVEEIIKITDEVDGIEGNYFKNPDTGNYTDSSTYNQFWNQVLTELNGTNEP